MRRLFLHAREQRERRGAHIGAVREAEEHQRRVPAQRSRIARRRPACRRGRTPRAHAAAASAVPDSSEGTAGWLTQARHVHAGERGRHGDRRHGNPVTIRHGAIIPHHRRRADRKRGAAPEARAACSSGMAPTTRATRPRRWCCTPWTSRTTRRAGCCERRVDRRASASASRRCCERRIDERVPLAYLTHEAWFAGLPFYVDERVLIPRSPIAELIERRFAPWIERRARAATCSTWAPARAASRSPARRRFHARGWMRWISTPAALEVAAINRRRLRLTRRVRLIESDHFAALSGSSYDIIVSNPPYVGDARNARPAARIPARAATRARVRSRRSRFGRDHPARGRASHLRPQGLLVVEVGNTERALARAFPQLPFTWLDFERGGGGVFLLTREQLEKAES